MLTLHRILGCLGLAAALLIVSARGQETTPQSLTWTGTTNAILSLNMPHTLGATASSGLPVTLRVDHGPATIADGTITVTGVGAVWVTAEQAEDATYFPVRESRSFNVRQAALTRVGGYETGGAFGVDVAGNYAYVAAGTNGLRVIDVSDPSKPVQVGEIDTGDGFASGVQIVGNVAYVADNGAWEGSELVGAGLQVIDVSHPANPIRLGSYATSDSVRDLHVVGNYAYLAVSTAGLQVIDVSNPADPMRVGGYGTSRSAEGVHVVENHAFVADMLTGLVVLDVSNPSHPVPVGGVGLRGAITVEVVGSFAYMGLQDFDSRLEVFDVSQPANPAPVGWNYTIGDVQDIRTEGNYAFAAALETGLQVFDVSNPVIPLRAGGYYTSGFAGGVQVVGNHIYVADLLVGLQILELRLGYPNTLDFNSPT